jgi:hypothetical protein
MGSTAPVMEAASSEQRNAASAATCSTVTNSGRLFDRTKSSVQLTSLGKDEDYEIRVEDRVALQVHVRICFACVRFVGQLNFMRRATRAWRRHCEA